MSTFNFQEGVESNERSKPAQDYLCLYTRRDSVPVINFIK